MRILHDLSLLVAPTTPEWPGDTPYSCGWTWDMAAGASVNVSALTTSPHVGTHADAPLHVRPGAAASDALPLDAFCGRAFLLDVSGRSGAIDLESIDDRLPSRLERLLLRTGRSVAAGGFPADWPTLSAKCVTALCARGLRLLGVDAPSIDPRESATLDAHHALFDCGGFNLENLDLRGVAEGEHHLVALPWRLAGLDAAPARAVLVEPG
ncbi:MAG TPA: cyclase family protein [Gemmatimonadaceae bacterium]